jgi:hypothetical protein
MRRNTMWGLLLILAGVVLNNYAYLHDVVTEKHDGYVYVGSRAVVAVLVSITVIAVGAWLATRRARPAA